MVNVFYWGDFRPVTASDLETLPETIPDVGTGEIIPNPFKNPALVNWVNEAGHFLFPDVRDATVNGNLTIAVDENNVVFGYGGEFVPALPGNGGRIFELEGVHYTAANDYRMKVFDPATGAVSEPPEPIPAAISPAQARIWLRRNGKRDAAEAMVATASEEIQDWYEYADSWLYNNVNVVAFCEALGINREQAFREAALIL